jgi:hypothetical protein
VIVRLPDGSAQFLSPATPLTRGDAFAFGRDGELFIPDLVQREDLSLQSPNGRDGQNFDASLSLGSTKFTVYGSGPRGQYPAAGNFSDTIAVTVTY